LGYKDIVALLRKALVTKQVDQLKLKDVPKWNCEDVSQWITFLGFPQYKEAFQNNEIK
jgi:hypothetical protein